jgi:type II secretion system protein J
LKIGNNKVKSLNRCSVKSLQRRDAFCDLTIQQFNDSTRRAFTLIEMILAVGIAALVLVTISTVLFSALNLREATVETVDAASPVDSAVNFLKRDLECCVTPTNGTTKILSGTFRVGTITSTGVSEPVAIEMFTATGAIADNAPWADIQRVTYELKNPTERGAVGQDLYRSVWRNLLSVSTPQVEDQFILSGVSSIKFSCYDGAIWNDTWDTTSLTSTDTNLPLAVRVTIQMAGNAAAQPIELVVPIDSVAHTNIVLATSMTGN